MPITKIFPLVKSVLGWAEGLAWAPCLPANAGHASRKVITLGPGAACPFHLEISGTLHA